MEKLVAYSFNASLKSDTKIPTYNEKGTFEVVKTIDQIKPGDFVKSRNEKTKKTIFIKVKKLHDHGKIPVFKFKLDDGTEVVCSMDHKFRVKDGRMLPIKQILVDNLEIEKL
jgi:intein/homing endonuclease